MHELALECSEAMYLLLADDPDAEIPSWILEAAEQH